MNQSFLGERVQSEKQAVGKHFVALCVRHFLEKYDRQMLKFINEFQKISVMDEKVALVEQMLNFLYSEMDRDPTWWVQFVRFVACTGVTFAFELQH